MGSKPFTLYMTDGDRFWLLPIFETLKNLYKFLTYCTLAATLVEKRTIYPHNKSPSVL